MPEHFTELIDILFRNIVQIDRAKIYFKVQAAFYNKINMFLDFVKGDMDMRMYHFPETAGSFALAFVSADVVVAVVLSFFFPMPIPPASIMTLS